MELREILFLIYNKTRRKPGSASKASGRIL